MRGGEELGLLLEDFSTVASRHFKRDLKRDFFCSSSFEVRLEESILVRTEDISTGTYR